MTNEVKNPRDQYEVARRRMVANQLVAGGIRDQKVLDAMGRVPRHEFVSPGMEPQAYFDRPLPIGDGQTISQPLIVAMMTEALNLKGNERVLEIGTGSGYQTAVLSLLTKEVFSIERLEVLSIRAQQALIKNGFNNVKLKIGDGTLGWPEMGPFDAIIVTAGSPKMPSHLQEQLADGGRMVVPVGGVDVQQLITVERHGQNFTKTIGPGCRFVKLIGENGW